ncbi:MAG: biotin/lipoyl-containing protein, partial [Pseudomonadota bacterium]
PGGVSIFGKQTRHFTPHDLLDIAASEGAAAGTLTAPMPGLVKSVTVAAGDSVEAGQVLAVLEAMKMEHQMRAPFAGTVAKVPVATGDQVSDGALIVEMDAPDA